MVSPYNQLASLQWGGPAAWTRRWVWHFRSGTKEEEPEGVMVDVEVVGGGGVVGDRGS